MMESFIGYGIYQFLNKPFDMTEEQYQTVCKVQKQMRDAVRVITIYQNDSIVNKSDSPVYIPYTYLKQEYP